MRYVRVIFLGIVVLVLFVLVVSNVINSPSFIAKRLNFDSKKSIEKLVFRVSYTNFIPLGEVIMENKGVEELGGKRLYHIKAYAKPNKFFDFFRKVKVEVDSFIDEDTFPPVKFTQDLQIQGKAPERKVVIYHQSEQFMEIGGEKRGIYSPTYDPLSLLFSFLNRKGLKKGEVIDLNINTNQKNYRLIAKVEESKKLHEKKIFWIRGKVKRRDGNLRHSSTFLMVMLDNPHLPIFVRVFSGLGFLSVSLVSIT
ncbi:MAG: hypothetical protein DRP81_05460 [Candidatus Omnitrophota bacterium]|nr:MAG: hypothetical protein DRP81_05460 [Candidatus Omnitrophota bacterium]